MRKVASGGELARISLAIEVAALGMDAVPTMVFDEVDSGIGGAVAEVVGQKLRALGASARCCASRTCPRSRRKGHQHLRVSKSLAGGGTASAVERLDEAARVEELARCWAAWKSRARRARTRARCWSARSRPDERPGA
jgi:DNA repair protein RecN (Recombination protein N)